VKDPYGGWSHQPLVEGNGAIVKWGQEEARDKSATWSTWTLWGCEAGRVGCEQRSPKRPKAKAV